MMCSPHSGRDVDDYTWIYEEERSTGPNGSSSIGSRRLVTSRRPHSPSCSPTAWASALCTRMVSSSGRPNPAHRDRPRRCAGHFTTQVLPQLETLRRLRFHVRD
jgi:hypothetical protein